MFIFLLNFDFFSYTFCYMYFKSFILLCILDIVCLRKQLYFLFINLYTIFIYFLNHISQMWQRFISLCTNNKYDFSFFRTGFGGSIERENTNEKFLLGSLEIFRFTFREMLRQEQWDKLGDRLRIFFATCYSHARRFRIRDFSSRRAIRARHIPLFLLVRDSTGTNNIIKRCWIHPRRFPLFFFLLFRA